MIHEECLQQGDTTLDFPSDSSSAASTDQGSEEAAAGQLSLNTVRVLTDRYVPSPYKMTHHYQGPEN